jgi:hypothetical protein
VLGQAKRYAAGIVLEGDATVPEGGPWGAHRVPLALPRARGTRRSPTSPRAVLGSACLLGGLVMIAPGCPEECLAACISSVEAEGDFVPPEGSLVARMCIGGECGEARRPAGEVSWEDRLWVEERSPGRLWVRLGPLREVAPKMGDVVELTITVEETGEELLSAEMLVRTNERIEVCGTRCTLAKVSWDPEG